MKFKLLEKTSSHDEHERFVMHIGREETEILIGLLRSFKKYVPPMRATHQALSRVKQMTREFEKSIGSNK